MLQRAASSAYSWWWASNIRTKQSKWLDADLEVMETRVKSMIQIVEQDGDSFAKKAEMYFKRRPELIEIVEETYKSYKALSDRYDHLSSELHKANHTLATAFPDQIHFDDDDDIPKAFSKIDASKLRKAPADIPPIGLMNRRKDNQAGLKKSRLARVISQNSKDKAQEEIDKLQKGILALQTEKEYIKSSYETGLSKYWEIEKRITDMQDEVFCLQDAFSASVEIEDDDARALMAATALKSCENSLARVEQEQKRSMEEARIGSERIMAAKEKLKTVKGTSGDLEEISNENSSSDDEGLSLNEENPDSESPSDNVTEHIEISSETSVVELAEKINDLVTKIIDMDLTATSQSAQIKTLRSEIDMLQRHLKSFEKEKKSLIHVSDCLREESNNLREESNNLRKESNALQEETNTLRDRLEEAEGKLLRAQKIEQQVQNERSMASKDSIVSPDSPNVISVESVPPRQHDQVYTAGVSQEVTSLCNIGAETTNKKEAKKTLELDQYENGELQKSSMESSVGVAEMSFKYQGQMEFSGPSREEVNGTKHEKEIEDSGSKEVVEVSHAIDNTGKQSLLIQEPGPGLKDQTIFHHSQAGSQLKDGQSQAAKNEVEISSLQEFNDVDQSEESKEHIERTSDHLRRCSQFKDDGVGKSKLVKQELEISLSEGDDSILLSKDSSPKLEGQLKWLQSLVGKLEGKEKVILAEYASVLQSYEDMKTRLSEAEKKSEEDLLQKMMQIKELQNANTVKDQEIHSLRKSLRSARSISDRNTDLPLPLPENCPELPEPASSGDATLKPKDRRFQSFDVSDRKAFLKKDIRPPATDGRHKTSIIEEKFRRDIDTVLEENLEFWLRFSTSFHGIQDFQKAFEEAEAEIKKLKPRNLGDSPAKKANNTDTLPIDKKLRELKTELQVWLEQNVMLQEELESKLSSISSMQEEVSGTLEATLEASLEPDAEKFAPYQAAKFQGELLNMQLENNKVADELKTGLDHMRTLYAEVEKTLLKLHERFELPKLDGGSSGEMVRQLSNKNTIPLKSFLFAPKPKKKTIFKCVNPALHIVYPQKKTITFGRP